MSAQDVFHRYVACRESASSEAQVRSAARRVLSEQSRARCFSTLTFTAPDCVTHALAQHTHSSYTHSTNSSHAHSTHAHCTHALTRFAKAAELLETLCVNLFLYPWRKEIRTLKKFTGHFVYYIQPVLPNEVTKSVLQSIGYSLETDTEYKLVDNADPNKAKAMGFELFLARLECEELLEMMDQNSPAECLEIIRERTSPLSTTSASLRHSVNVADAEPESVKVEALEENPQVNGSSPLDMETTPDQESLERPSELEVGQESLERPSELEVGQEPLERPSELEVDELQSEGPAGRKPSNPYLSEDRSILEMQKNYPDLAFRLKPIFKMPERRATGPKLKNRSEGRDLTEVHLQTADTDLSGPQSITLHAETSTPPRRKPQVPALAVDPRSAEHKQTLVLRVESVLKPGFSQEDSADDGVVTELTMMMGQMQMKEFSADEPLKYPVEETAQTQQCGAGPQDYPAISPRDQNPPPVVCSPSQQPGCPLASCGGCAGSVGDLTPNDPIKEPPHSFYIPNCLSGCNPSLAPSTDHDQSSSSDGSGQQLQRSPTQQPEDDLLQTFIFV